MLNVPPTARAVSFVVSAPGQFVTGCISGAGWGRGGGRGGLRTQPTNWRWRRRGLGPVTSGLADAAWRGPRIATRAVAPGLVDFGNGRAELGSARSGTGSRPAFEAARGAIASGDRRGQPPLVSLVAQILLQVTLRRSQDGRDGWLSRWSVGGRLAR